MEAVQINSLQFIELGFYRNKSTHFDLKRCIPPIDKKVKNLFIDLFKLEAHNFNCCNIMR